MDYFPKILDFFLFDNKPSRYMYQGKSKLRLKWILIGIRYWAPGGYAAPLMTHPATLATAQQILYRGEVLPGVLHTLLLLQLGIVPQQLVHT